MVSESSQTKPEAEFSALRASRRDQDRAPAGRPLPRRGNAAARRRQRVAVHANPAEPGKGSTTCSSTMPSTPIVWSCGSCIWRGISLPCWRNCGICRRRPTC